MNVLLVDPEQRLPGGLADLLNRTGWNVDSSATYEVGSGSTWARPPDIIVTPEPPSDGDSARTEAFRRFVAAAGDREVATLLLSSHPSGWRVEESPFVDIAADGISNEEIHGRLATMVRYHGMVRGMERELRNMRRLSERLNEHFTELDHEMQLAGRLQRDFLPTVTAPIGPLKFATLFRPASWVSGDIFDITRLDEDHVAFWVADAVGHGVAASLLTMFIKKAIVSKRVYPGSYEVLEPPDTMRLLNNALAQQDLPNCQFVTACYCVVNTRTLELQCCRGGHPYPYLVDSDGSFRELKPAGSLLGLFRDEEFEVERVQLKPGQKLILYSDGLETAFCPQDTEADEFTYYRHALRDLCKLPVEEIVSRLDARLNAEYGSINPRDDVTLVAMQVLGT